MADSVLLALISLTRSSSKSFAFRLYPAEIAAKDSALLPILLLFYQITFNDDVQMVPHVPGHDERECAGGDGEAARGA